MASAAAASPPRSGMAEQPAAAAAPARGTKRKAAVLLTPDSADSFLRRFKRACSQFQPEIYEIFCQELSKAAAAAKEAADASKFEEEAAITRQLLVRRDATHRALSGATIARVTITTRPTPLQRALQTRQRLR